MTGSEIFAMMPLIILAGGSVLVLLAGAIKPGSYLYVLSGTLILAALLFSLLVPVDAVMPGLAVTPFSRFMAVFIASTGLIGLWVAAGYNRRRSITGEEYPATLLFLLAGMWAACAANDLLILFLGLEAFTFGFYILVAIRRDSLKGGEAGLKYLLNGTLSAAVLGMGLALLYAATGTLKIGGLALGANQPGALFLAGACLVLIGLAFKLSLVPAHLWTADVYQGAPAPVTALLSTASKGASLAALILLLPILGAWSGLRDLLWWVALLSMLAGNFAALLQVNIKRMLAWSSVAQMGYVAMALVAAPVGGASAALFYMLVYSAAGLASFGALSVLSDRTEPAAIDDYRGLGYRSPLAGGVLAVAMFSLSGIPPAAGFIGKFGVFAAALRAGETALAVIGMLAALVSVYFYLRVVVMLYMKSGEEQVVLRPLNLSEIAALAVPTAATVLLGVHPQLLLDVLTKILPK